MVVLILVPCVWYYITIKAINASVSVFRKNGVFVTHAISIFIKGLDTTYGSTYEEGKTLRFLQQSGVTLGGILF
jgi:hypothetical protein